MAGFQDARDAEREQAKMKTKWDVVLCLLVGILGMLLLMYAVGML